MLEQSKPKKDAVTQYNKSEAFDKNSLQIEKYTTNERYKKMQMNSDIMNDTIKSLANEIGLYKEREATMQNTISSQSVEILNLNSLLKFEKEQYSSMKTSYEIMASVNQRQLERSELHSKSVTPRSARKPSHCETTPNEKIYKPIVPKLCLGELNNSYVPIKDRVIANLSGRLRKANSFVPTIMRKRREA